MLSYNISFLIALCIAYSVSRNIRFSVEINNHVVRLEALDSDRKVADHPFIETTARFLRNIDVEEMQQTHFHLLFMELKKIYVFYLKIQ